MKFKVLTDRCNSYTKGQVIEVDPNKSRVAIEQTYRALFTMARNGEAEIIEPLEAFATPIVKKAVKKVVKKSKKK